MARTPPEPRIVCTCPEEGELPYFHCTAPDCKRLTSLKERLGRMTFEQIIRELERKVCGEFVPGTMLNRVLIDDKLSAKHKIPPPTEGDCKAWCLSFGLMHESKHHFYGRTIGEAVLNAWVAVHSGDKQ